MNGRLAPRRSKITWCFSVSALQPTLSTLKVDSLERHRNSLGMSSLSALVGSYTVWVVVGLLIVIMSDGGRIMEPGMLATHAVTSQSILRLGCGG